MALVAVLGVGLISHAQAEESSAAAAAVAAAAAAETEARRHVQTVENWRQERHENLTKSDSWLSLVGLSWLQAGANVCGSDPASDVQLPESAPARLGVLRLLEDGSVELLAEADVKVDGKIQRRAKLASDAEGKPTLVELGKVLFHLIDRDGRIGVRVKDRESPALVGFEGIESFAVDSRWRVEARFLPYDPPKSISVPTVLGSMSEVPSPGAVEMRVAGRSHRLDVLPGGEGEYFIVFGDVTNGKETYGGGRFLYAEAADSEGRVVLDFNLAYNPPCAFTPYATCPLPPRQNRLELAVRAGEKKVAGGIDH